MSMPALPERIDCILAEQAGGPDVLKLHQRPLIQPGKGEVLIQVAAAGVNRPDVLQRKGEYPPPAGASDIIGLEVAGHIVAVGDGVATSRLGKAVCALVTGGGYATHCIAATDLCLPIPEGLDMIRAAALPETFFTVWSNVFERGHLQAGESILIHGGSSGIGTTAIQIAHARGAKVLTTAGSEAKAAFCRQLGAELAINYQKTDFVKAVKEHTGGRGVDVILDMVGGDYVQRNLSALAIEGRLLQIAFLNSSKLSLNLMPLMLKRLTLSGSTLRARSIAQKAQIAHALLTEIWPLLSNGQIKPIIHTTFPLAQAAKAHHLMESSQHIGKIVLIP